MGNKAYLVLENGKVFCGEAFGAAGEVTAEVVFTTGMTGYLETLTDKSCFGQIVVQTFPLIGNYGVISSDFEGAEIGPSGYIVKEWCQSPSNFRSEGDLDTFFKARGVVGLCGIDTRALTKTLRENGTMNGVITADPKTVDLGALSAYRVKNAVESVSVKEIERRENTQKRRTVAVLDYGVKESLLGALESHGAEVILCPHTTTAKEIEALHADGIVLSGGPGDPKENAAAVENLKEIQALGLPIFAVGLGHQLLALAHGFDTVKLLHGHRGANQPVKDLSTGRVYITAQSHSYAVDTDSVKADTAEIAFRNVNDKTCEGIRYKSIPALSVQFDPRDPKFLLDTFFTMMQKEEA